MSLNSDSTSSVGGHAVLVDTIGQSSADHLSWGDQFAELVNARLAQGNASISGLLSDNLSSGSVASEYANDVGSVLLAHTYPVPGNLQATFKELKKFEVVARNSGDAILKTLADNLKPYLTKIESQLQDDNAWIRADGQARLKDIGKKNTIGEKVRFAFTMQTFFGMDWGLNLPSASEINSAYSKALKQAGK